jgi:RluA family pseudouridine synthase
VLYRDGLILVIDKPAGLAVHAGPSRAPNLEECFDALRFGLPRPPALAHRLDADTSGVLVLGRHPKALSKLGRLFQARDTEKTYWAVVQGTPPADEGAFDQKLLKVNTRSGWSVKVSDKGQTAITRYKVLGRGSDTSGLGMTWLELKPETGRTHQIRVHLSALRHPCVGDLTYGADPVLAKRLGLSRQWLHARSLGFAHPADGRWVEFVSPYPADLADALDRLRA